MIVSVLTALYLTVNSCIISDQSDHLFDPFLFFAFPYSFLFVFLYGFIASIIGEIIVGVINPKKARLLIKLMIYGIFLSRFLFVAMKTTFFAYLGIVAAIMYIIIDEYLRKRPNLASRDRR